MLMSLSNPSTLTALEIPLCPPFLSTLDWKLWDPDRDGFVDEELDVEASMYADGLLVGVLICW